MCINNGSAFDWIEKTWRQLLTSSRNHPRLRWPPHALQTTYETTKSWRRYYWDHQQRIATNIPWHSPLHHYLRVHCWSWHLFLESITIRLGVLLSALGPCRRLPSRPSHHRLVPSRGRQQNPYASGLRNELLWNYLADRVAVRWCAQLLRVCLRPLLLSHARLLY